MSHRSSIWQSHRQPPRARLAGKVLESTAERIISEHIGRRWYVQEVRDVSDLASHPAAILSDGSYSVFAKYDDAVDAKARFVSEVEGLHLLSDEAGILSPAPVGIFPLASGYLLMMEAVLATERTPCRWRQIGRTLARIHQVKGERFGLDSHGYFGPFRQNNTLEADWPTFYAAYRLSPALRWAVDSGQLSTGIAHQVETIITRVPELCGPEVRPSLLHGDAQQNNFISGTQGAIVIDPAVYYGNPEMDLAYLDFFQPVPGDVFDGYREMMLIEPGFWERRDLWRLWGYLGCVAAGGPEYMDGLCKALCRYA